MLIFKWLSLLVSNGIASRAASCPEGLHCCRVYFGRFTVVY